MGSAFAHTSITVHFCWLTACLYEDQISIGVIAVTHNPAVSLFCLAALNSGKCICPDQHCSAFLLAHCTPVRRSNLHRCDCSDTQACCEPVLPSSTEMWEIHLPIQHCSAFLLAHCIPVRRSNLHRCVAVTHKPVVSLFCLAALNSGKCICPDQHCSAFLLAHCIPVRRSNLHRCDTQACCEPVLPSSTICPDQHCSAFLLAHCTHV